MDSVTAVISVPADSEKILEIIERLLSLLPADVGEDSRRRLRVGLQELLQNAYEHGSLGISGAEKREACDRDRFEQLRSEREALPALRSRKVRAEARVENGTFICIISDEGQGFDWRSVLSAAADESRDSSHGRGVFIAAQVFDELSYNESGTEVTARFDLL